MAATAFLAQSSIQSKSAQLIRTQLTEPSRFKRLLQIASFTQRETRSNDSISCREHLEIFEDWLLQGLHEKEADIQRCAAHQGCSASVLLLYWTNPRHMAILFPASALAPQRELFAMELEVLFLVV